MSKTFVFNTFSVSSNKLNREQIRKNNKQTRYRSDKEACSFLKSSIKIKKHNPYLEAGKKLPKIHRKKFPSKLIGVPLEDIDEYYEKDNVNNVNKCWSL